ncbi:MAG TPA: hypothetical protein VGQ99_05905 [Tepidisphaeraceae bacterium]|jgi:hypothetical protein|nr:hypothetical protein [Tepidisphaeraceae bacterium]
MPASRCLLLLLASFSLAAAPTPPPQPSHQIRLAYFIPSDRTPTPNHEKKIRTIMSIVADLYLTDLKSKGCATDGLRFESDENGKNNEPVIHLIRGDKPAIHYNNAPRYDATEQWRRLAPQIKSKLGDPQRQVIVVFAETYDEGPAERLWPGVIARGGYNNADGGLAIFSAHLLKNEFCALTLPAQRKLFFDNTPVPGRASWNHRPPAPRCDFVEDGIGAVAHELGHALGLPHDRRQDDIYIMGNGFRNLRWNLSPTGGPGGKKACFSDEDARLLMSSRYVARDLDLSDNDPPKVEANAQRISGAWTITVKASDNSGLRSILFFDKSAQSTHSGRQLTGKSINFNHRLPDIKTPNLQLLLIVTDNGGHQTRISVDSAQ